MAEPEKLIGPHGGYRKLKSFQVARASLEELRLDYEDFLRQRGLAQWEREDPRRADLIARRCSTADEVHLVHLRRDHRQWRPGADRGGVQSARPPTRLAGESLRGRGRFHRTPLPGAQPEVEEITITGGGLKVSGAFSGA
jgi:hypothetical protein